MCLFTTSIRKASEIWYVRSNPLKLVILLLIAKASIYEQNLYEQLRNATNSERKTNYEGGVILSGGGKGGDPTDDDPPHKMTPQRSQIIRGVLLIRGGRL